MAQNNKKQAEDQKAAAEREKMRAKMERERAKAKKKAEKDRAKQARDAERYEKQAAEARKKAAETRAEQERLQNDPAYQEKKRKEEERLKEKGRKQIEKNRRESEKLAAKAKKEREKNERKRAKQGGGLSGMASKGSAAKGGSGAAGKATKANKGGGKDDKKSSKRASGSIAALIVIVIITIAAAIMLYPPQDKITMGLDIQGGVSVNLKATTSDGGTPTSDEMSEAQAVISSRVNSSGASAATVQMQGNDSFLVQVPGAEDSQSILDTLSSQGVLEFVRVDSIEDETVQGYIDDNLTGMNLKDEGVEYTAFMTGDSVENVTVGRSQGSADYSVNLDLDDEGTEEFAEVTSELVSDNGKIAILLDGVVKSAPAVQAAITNGEVSITGNYSSEEANELKAIIDSGSLPVSLSIQQSSVVGPTLGQNALTTGIISAAIGIALVIVWLLLFYKGLGLLASFAIIIMSIVYLGLLALMSQVGWFSLTLPGIAGIIVNIGMSADSSILIMECFHEQIREGKSIKSASRAGVHEGIFTSLDADFVTLVSALILYFLAVGDVRGFGLTLAIGIVCDLVIMALFSGPIIRIVAPLIFGKSPTFWGIRDDMNEGAYINEHVHMIGAGKAASAAAQEGKAPKTQGHTDEKEVK